ncbi:MULTISPECIES: hypothetical protein [unclassified Cyanobium]|uniref:hypothetical protein n=1 Tax=unclassified Cyanobium TaxID=2627006 RepID=UPI0020CD9C30|nr:MULTISPECIES: hypothetical protein [unclassified Cyanobium]MCP9860909.1 hypothetical protein [Cyanobium sp. Cruz-8H5]MCP9868153.1 hypothetical protein [Cyanobium sp. Cruz-8D1]
MTQPTTGLAAHGPLPAGMLRIRQGQQERYVWPVHLPGWLALGWRVAGAETTAGAPSVGVSTAEPQVPIATAAGEPPEQGNAKPAATRGRRGRRRKEELEPAAAADDVAPAAQQEPQPEATPAEPDLVIDEVAALVDVAADDTEPSESAAQTEAHAEPDTDTAAELPVLTALPDDLFDDQLI